MTQEQTMTYIRVDKLLAHPENPRKDLGDLTELADSIRAKGVLQNLTVVPIDKGNPYTSYTVIIGHRRLAAAKQAGLESLPCIIADMTHAEQIETMLLENMARSDLTFYEQAIGFQQLSMLGSDVAEIAEKTGFSASTVRRRLKMAELDHDLLREAAGKQITIGDFDKLNQIDDLKTRNALLRKIGTPSFTYDVNNAINLQTTQKAKDGMKPWLEAAGLAEIPQSATWGGNYCRVSGVRYDEWKAGTSPIPDGDTPNAYCFGYSSIEFYNIVKQEKPKKSEEEIERERYIAETREELTRIARTAYETRKAFVESCRVTAQNTSEILRGAFIGASWCVCYRTSGRDDVADWLGFTEEEKKGWLSPEKYAGKMFEKGNREGLNKVLPETIWLALFGDNEREICWSRYVGEFPRYEENKRLAALYDWLINLGYEISDTERQMLDGTLPLLVDKDPPEESDEEYDEEEYNEEDWYGEEEDEDVCGEDPADGAGLAFAPDAEEDEPDENDDDLTEQLKDMYWGR